MAKNYGMNASIYKGSDYSWYTLELNNDDTAVELLHCFRETAKSMAAEMIRSDDKIDTAITLLKFAESISEAIKESAESEEEESDED